MFGIALVAISDPECRFVGSATEDYASDLTAGFFYYVLKTAFACGTGLL